MEKIDYSKFDEKTINTMKFSAIWNAVAMAITSIAGSLAVYYFARSLYSDLGIYGSAFAGAYAPQLINFGSLVSSIIWGAIWGAVGGYIIAKFYPVLMGWQKQFLGDKLNTLFKLLFWPYVIGALLSLLMAGGFSYMYGGFTGSLIVIIGDLIAGFVYAKMMAKNVGKYY
jgi:hypothetical protein